MSQSSETQSRVHDLLAASLGGLAALALISSPWNVDTTGPDPFYKGPLIFPLLVLSLMILASLPGAWRLIRPPEGAAWRFDGQGFPLKTLVVLGLLLAALLGLKIFGLEASGLGFLMISLRYLGHRGLVRTVLVPLILVGLVVLVFKHFLGVFFPTPLVVEWFSE